MIKLWDTDEIRGETSCSVCGYVAEENMIDLGAEWTNHSEGKIRAELARPQHSLFLTRDFPLDKKV